MQPMPLFTVSKVVAIGMWPPMEPCLLPKAVQLDLSSGVYLPGRAMIDREVIHLADM